MRFPMVLLAAACVAACGPDPVVRQSEFDTRYDPVRADAMAAVTFAPGASGPDALQVNELRAMVAAGRRAQRDEFVVVSDGTGGPIQRTRAERVSRTLSEAGARWVSTSVEPGMATGTNAVVVVRSEYLLGVNNCPSFHPATIGNPYESVMPGFGCASAYNLGQVLARPRDAAVGRGPGPADATVNAAAIARYREGKVRALPTILTTTTDSAVGGPSGGSQSAPPPTSP